MSTPHQLTELDLVNPYMSPLRQWVCTQMALLAPSPAVVIASHDGRTKHLFKEWTGQTQEKLETAWRNQGFTKTNDPKKGVWTRDGQGPVTTSCEGLIGRLLEKIRDAGFDRNPAADRGRLRSFDLPGLGPTGKEPATTRGWHWFRDRTAAVRPRPGDFFQVGRPWGAGAWYFHHVGVITWFDDGENPTWTTVEAGQGGPATGFDFLRRRGPRLLNPVDARFPKKVLMGWLDIDEYFAAPNPDQKKVAGFATGRGARPSHPARGLA